MLSRTTTLNIFAVALALPALRSAQDCTGLGGGAGSNNTGQKYLIELHREEHPIRRNGAIIAHKASYYGSIRVGHPEHQEFRVVFDTGSAHLVLPSVDCESAVCSSKSRYNSSQSTLAQAVNLDGSLVLPDETYDEASIGFGTGRVTGRFIRERVCLGVQGQTGPCVKDLSMVAATEMSSSPFELFGFDGILGLGLEGLALSPNFSLPTLMAASGQFCRPHFGVFLAGSHGQTSEISFGGHNAARLEGPLAWVPVVKKGLGYWQVEIHDVLVDGERLEICNSTQPCQGLLDTGTSHMGVPSNHLGTLSKLLSVPTESSADCQGVAAPTVELHLPGTSITLTPQDYMRPLPLRRRVGRGSAANVQGVCTPKLSAVSLPAVGANVFVLGEVVLQRYYTVYDWETPQVGFGLANHPLRDQNPEKTESSGQAVLV